MNGFGKLLSLCLLGVMLLSACSTAPLRQPNPAAMAYGGGVESRLGQHYRRWHGTPYRMGGLSARGIDCSGFVVVTYRDVFGVGLPRSTDELEDVGASVDLEQARAGDLLIFKTGLWRKHAGVYLGGGRFMHASASRGVITSSLASEYWRKAYRDTRRVVAL
jgi:cell wall-associated NlpC family hydrolase